MNHERPKAVVAGTRFGRIYLEALSRPDSPCELVGILSKSGARSRDCAKHYSVPLLDSVEAIPPDVQIGCVVVGTGVVGGPGTEIATAMMDRGLHVLQEHPLHSDELAQCVRAARRNKVMYRVNTLYGHLTPVREFLRAGRLVLARAGGRYLEAHCAIQLSYTMFDILGQLLGGLRPYRFFDPMPVGSQLSPRPFMTLEGELSGVPITLRIQNQIDPTDPDSRAHLLHRITLFHEGGQLTLLNTHGPVLWSPRPAMPREAESSATMHAPPVDFLDYPSAESLGSELCPSYRQIIREMWPAAVVESLRCLCDGGEWQQEAQYQLTLSRLWQDATARLGYPELLTDSSPVPFSADAVRGG